jgi:Protein of unknown function (DUF3365)
MPSLWKIMQPLLCGMACVLCLSLTRAADPVPGEKDAAPVQTPATPSKPKIDDKNRVPVEVARDRAKLMHDIYSATLDVIHHRYFHREKATIPARAMEDIFAEMKLQSQSEARWIAVNLRAMSIDHEPETEFERQAARELATGKLEFEAIEDGYLRRATPIPLTEGCISCHEGGFKAPSKIPKYAGLVISIPIKN